MSIAQGDKLPDELVQIREYDVPAPVLIAIKNLDRRAGKSGMVVALVVVADTGEDARRSLIFKMPKRGLDMFGPKEILRAVESWAEQVRQQPGWSK